jgi:hypothetical protein
VRFVAKRAEREGERFDRAIAQYYREWLWKHLVAEGPTAEARDVLASLLETRKVAAYEKKAAPKRKRDLKQVSERIVDLLGELPPIIPYTGPLEPPKPETPTPNH